MQHGAGRSRPCPLHLLLHVMEARHAARCWCIMPGIMNGGRGLRTIEKLHMTVAMEARALHSRLLHFF